MKTFIATMAAACAAAKQINLGPVTSKGEDIAIVWVQGAECDNAGY
jgi:hypothetical protein